MAFVMSAIAIAIALAFTVNDYLGVALASYVGETGDNFSGLPHGLLIQVVCTLLPLFWSFCIPGEKSKGKKKGNSDIKSN
ncbi:probable folate-biopterin transporter 7 [Olea europaea subsp. europaea]|uniref:Probable folate-biopterin transporter 7 n=1 Tax=Olea europaea subsp. europaea TaxID=158383 RepID=A0A8S0Q9T4_OLEEU|nr:probable folate-biopterin transporter 7 [Olea europaea subsp. europaea]